MAVEHLAVGISAWMAQPVEHLAVGISAWMARPVEHLARPRGEAATGRLAGFNGSVEERPLGWEGARRLRASNSDSWA
jgi:hypothetical protein